MDGMEMLTGAIGTAIGTGAQNTLDILAFCSEEGIAAKLCADYEVTVGGVTYDDWFLPTKAELNFLYLERDVVGGFANFKHYNSWQDNSTSALYHNFIDGIQRKVIKNQAQSTRC